MCTECAQNVHVLLKKKESRHLTRPTAIANKLCGPVLSIPTSSRSDHLYLHTERHWLPSDVRHQSLSGLGCSQSPARHNGALARRLTRLSLHTSWVYFSCESVALTAMNLRWCFNQQDHPSIASHCLVTMPQYGAHLTVRGLHPLCVSMVRIWVMM
jgi:hypothetical protein